MRTYIRAIYGVPHFREIASEEYTSILFRFSNGEAESRVIKFTFKNRW